MINIFVAMNYKRLIINSISAILLILLLNFVSCRGPSKTEEAPEVTQQIETPTLIPHEKKQGKALPEGEREYKEKEAVKPSATQTVPIELPAPKKPPEPALPPPAEPAAPPHAPPSPAPPSPAPAEGQVPSLSAIPFTPPTAGPPPAKEAAQPVPFVPSVVKPEANIDVIIDASGSQSALFGGTGTTKLSLQEKALSDVVLSLKSSEYPRNIGIRAFGSQKPLEEHDCQDTLQIYPVSTPNLDEIQKLLTPLNAQGESPIASALEAAAKDFPPANVDQIMILITDGTDTCGGNPCEIARSLRSSNSRLSIQVIGFDISQEDADKIKCVAENADGKFYLARDEGELRKYLDEAVNSTVPYNLRLSTLAGATPIPVTITIFKGGTDQVVKTETSFGTKLLSLAPGTYDILVEYTASPELKKPSKIIKGVDVLEKTKVEQEINFDFGSLMLSSIDTVGALTAAEYNVKKTETGETAARIDSEGQTVSVLLTPGTYDVTARQKFAPAEKIELTDKNIEIKSGESVEKIFRFQKGTLALKGVTTQNAAIPFIFQIYRPAKPDEPVASGAFDASGGTVTLSPDEYEIIFIGQDPSMAANPRTKVSPIEVRAGETAEITASFEMGVLKISAIDISGKPVMAAFEIKTSDTKEVIAQSQTTAAGAPVSLTLPPGKYDVAASKLDTAVEPKPSVTIPGVDVSAEKAAELTVRFSFGTVRVRGRNVKEQPLKTAFKIYRAGTQEEIAASSPSADWLNFDLPRGVYDVEAINMDSGLDPKPSLWIKDINVEEGKQISHEAIFTAGKLKVIGRGPNNKIITCHFKVYQYRTDTELINGDTGDDWQVFEIEPGSYYLEAAYVDPEASVLLKKWINVKVGENEVLELVLRF
jgi:Ca-activated chloride channel family protein